jgi:hypothetical protein
MFVGREELWLKSWLQNDAAVSGPPQLPALSDGLFRLGPE